MEETSMQSEHLHLRIADCFGQITIVPWAALRIQVDGSAAAHALTDAKGNVQLHDLRGDLRVHIPFGCVVDVRHHEGALQLEGVSSARFCEILGPLTVTDAESVLIEADPPRTDTANRPRLARDVYLHDVEEIVAEEIHGALTIHKAGQAMVGPVGGSVTLRAIRQDVSVGSIGGRCQAQEISGTLRLSHVGGGVELYQVRTLGAIGNVGGNLILTDVGIAPSARLHSAVGGNAHLELPVSADLTLRAVAAGGLVGAQRRRGPAMQQLSFGNGRGAMQLMIGGSLMVQQLEVSE